MTTKFDAMTHIVHYVNLSELEMIESEMNEDNVLITPQIFAAHLCTSLNGEITEIMRRHFKLNDEFFASYRKKTGMNEHASKVKDEGNGNEEIPRLEKRESLFRRVVTDNVMARSHLLGNEEFRRDGISDILVNYFDKFGKGFDSQQINDEVSEMMKLSRESKQYEDENLDDVIEVEHGVVNGQESNNANEDNGLLEMTGLPPQPRVIDINTDDGEEY